MSGENEFVIGVIFIGLSAVAVFAYAAVYRYAKLVAKPILYAGNRRMQSLVEKCPSLNKPMWPTPYCWGVHSQLVPFVLRGIWDRFVAPPYKYAREAIRSYDGELIFLNWVVSMADARACNGLPVDHTGIDKTPVVMLHHGAMCDHEDMPGQGYIQAALDRGWYVCVLSRRGHSGFKLTKPKWNFFGCVQDLKVASQRILRNRPSAKLFNIGLSSGSGLVINCMADESTDFSAAVCVAAGFNIENCMKRIRSPYMDLLLWRAKEFFLKANEDLLKNLPGYKQSLEAKDMQEWLDNTYAMAGFHSKDQYNLHTNPIHSLFKSKRPTLHINSENDPVCVVQNVYDLNETMSNTVSNMALALTKTGSHLPFYEGLWAEDWAEKVTYEFFDAFLATRG